MSGLCFTCLRCGERVPAGGGFAVQHLVDTGIVVLDAGRRPVDVPRVLGRRDYLDSLPAVEEFLRAHEDHAIALEVVEGLVAASPIRDRPPYFVPERVADGFLRLKAGGRFVRADFLLARHPVTPGEFAAVLGPPAASPAADPQAMRATWEEALRYCNELSRRAGLRPAYDEASGDLIDGAGQPAQSLPEVEGFRLPTGIEWDYAARGGRPDPPYAEWAGVLSQIYWDDPTSHYARPIPPREPATNVIGLVGMLGLVREWCSELPRGAAGRRICGWSHHETNYDCLVAYHVAGEVAAEGATHPFRIARSAGRW